MKNIMKYVGISLFIALMFTGCFRNLDIFIKERVNNINEQDELGKTLLYEYTEKDNIDMVRYALENGADSNITAYSGHSPLIIATQNANFEIIKELVSNDADINYKMKNRVNALYQLLNFQDKEKNYIPIVQYMIDNGADYRTRALTNYTLLHVAKNVEMIEYLRQLGLDIYAVADNNITTLMSSIRENDKGLEVSRYLINNCVDVSVEAKKGDKSITAYDLAIKRESVETAKLIQEAINNPNKECHKGDFTPPLIEFYNILETLDSKTPYIGIEVLAQGSGVGKIKILVNDTELSDDNISLNKEKKSADFTRFRVNLGSSFNEIRVEAYEKYNMVKSSVIFHTLKPKVEPEPIIHAILVGIDSPELKTAEADALLVGSTLYKRSKELFNEEEIRYLKNRSQTTKEAILNSLNSLNNISSKDMFIFYVATTGKIVDGKYYMITSDMQSSDDDYIKENALSEDEIREVLKHIPAKNKLLIFDTTFSGSLNNTVAKELTKSSMERLNIASITSVGSKQIKSDNELKGPHGIFAYVLSDALDGEADINNNGIVESDELIKYVSEVFTTQLQDNNSSQKPSFFESGDSFNITKLRAFEEPQEINQIQEVNQTIEEDIPKVVEIEISPELVKVEDKIAEVEEIIVENDEEVIIDRFHFSIKGDTIFLNSKDELKNHFDFTNEKGEHTLVFDFYSDEYIPHTVRNIQNDKILKIEVGYHKEFYRIVLYTKTKLYYDYNIAEDGIYIKILD